MTKHLAIYTFVPLRRPADDPANAGFFSLMDQVIDHVDRAPGLIARSGYPDTPGPPSWGPYVLPEFYTEIGDGWAPATLSLWQDVESVRQFAYHDLHAIAMRRKPLWFDETVWPTHALWWVDAGHRPTWREAVLRHALLYYHGPSEHVFAFTPARGHLQRHRPTFGR